MKSPFKKLVSRTLSGFVVMLVGGCITPAYYSHEQDVSITIPEGASAEMDGKQLEQKGNTVYTKVNRSWVDKEITVKKEGYKDETVKLKSVATKDRWSKTSNLFSSKRSSGASLLIPIHTLLSAGAVVAGTGALGAGLVTLNGHEMSDGLLMEGLGAVTLPAAAAIDLFNIFIGLPSTAIVNPWTEYKYDKAVYKMEPSEKIE